MPVSEYWSGDQLTYWSYWSHKSYPLAPETRPYPPKISLNPRRVPLDDCERSR